MLRAVDTMPNDPQMMAAVDAILERAGKLAMWHYAAMLHNWANNFSANGECRVDPKDQAEWLYSHFMGLPDDALRIVTGKGRLEWLQSMEW